MANPYVMALRLVRRVLIAAFVTGTAVSALATASVQEKTPTDIFTAYRTALAKAVSYSDVLPFMDAKSRGMIEALPETQRGGMFDLLKKFSDTFTDVAVAKETITEDAAVLALTGKDLKGQPATGSVTMTKEAAGWKVGREKWSSKPVTK